MGSGKMFVFVSQLNRLPNPQPNDPSAPLRIDMGMKLMIATGPRSGLEAEGKQTSGMFPSFANNNKGYTLPQTNIAPENGWLEH